MTASVEGVPAIDRDVAVAASGLLRRFSEYGVLTWADVHPAQHLCFLFGEKDERVMLAAALCVRALRAGSLCVSLAGVAEEASGWEASDGVAGQGEGADVPAVVPADAWPVASDWLAAVAASPAVRDGEGSDAEPRPLRLVEGLLYLERYWQDSETVRRHILQRLGAPDAPLGALPPRLSDDPRAAGQEAAIASALSRRLTVIAGGPGTGKTRVIARIVQAFHLPGTRALVGLAAPTGKAAARMTESLREAGLHVSDDAAASTVHRLLGWRPGSRSRFRHDAGNPLPHDLIVVDEVSMVSMTLMARLLDALKPEARLVLVGDPDQLASVEAGAVLADLVGAPALAPSVVRLDHNFRFEGAIQALATAIRSGDADAAFAVLASSGHEVLLLPPGAEGDEALRGRCVAAGSRVFAAAAAGADEPALSAAGSHRVLCAHRRGGYGVIHWDRTITSWLVDDVAGYAVQGEFYMGRPLIMTRNAADLGLYNGDTGVLIAGADGRPEAVFATGMGPRRYSPYLLDGLQSVHAMTIHKSQGSQFKHVSVVLPPLGSPLLTRELLYTAVTRASDGVLIVGTPEAVRSAIERPAARTSGLRARL